MALPQRSQTFFNSKKSFFAPSGSGGGSSTSTFTTATISTLSVSTITSPVNVRDVDVSGNHFIYFQDEPLNGAGTGGARGAIVYSFGGANTGFIALQSSIKGYDGAEDPAGGIRLSGGDGTQSISIGGSAGNSVFTTGFLEAFNLANTTSTITSHLNSQSIETGALTINGASVPFTYSVPCNPSCSSQVASPSNIGATFNTTSNHTYNVSFNFVPDSNSFLATSSANPSLYFFVQGEPYGESRIITKFEVSSMTEVNNYTSIPISFTYTSAEPSGAKQIFLGVNDATPSAEGGGALPEEKVYITSYGQL